MKITMLVVVGLGAAAWGTETEQIQGEIDAASARGGGRVVISRGVHPCGTLYLKSNVELHLEEGAELQGGERPEDYDDAIPVSEVYSYAGAVPATVTRKAFVYAENATNIAITGKGMINGRGQAFFNQQTWAKPTDKLRPRMVVFMRCANIRFEDATFRDSPLWTMWLRHCENISVARITIDNDQRMINSDGIDFDACRHVRVGDSSLSTGDDCLILRAIRHASDAGHDVVTEDVVVSNCTLSTTCQGVRIACASDDIIRNALFRDITFTGLNAIYAAQEYRYLEEGDTGRIRTSNIAFENWTISCSGWPINVSVENGVTLSDFGHMTFSNIVLTAKKPIKIAGNGTSVVDDITLMDISGTVTAGGETLVTNRVANLRTSGLALVAQTPVTTPEDGLVVGCRDAARNELDITGVLHTQVGGHLYVGLHGASRENVLRITRATYDYRTQNGSGDVIVGYEPGACSNRLVLTGGTLKYDRRWIALGQRAGADGNALELTAGSSLIAPNSQLQIGYGGSRCRMLLDGGSTAQVSLFALKNGATLAVAGAGNRLEIGEEGYSVADGCEFRFTPADAPHETPLLTVNRNLAYSAARRLVVDLAGCADGTYALLACGETLPAVVEGKNVVFANLPAERVAHVVQTSDGKGLRLNVRSAGTEMVVR